MRVRAVHQKVELADGSVLTVYYQKAATTKDKCGLFWTRWRLPEKR